MQTLTDLKPVRVRSVPSLQEAIAHLGELKKDQDRLTADRDRRIAEIQAAFTPDVDALDQAINDQMARIGSYVDANREGLFGKKSSAQFETGKVAVRKGRTVAVVDDEGAAIDALKGRRGKVAACLVTKTSLSKAELAKQQPEIDGVRYETTRERLQITPTSLGSVISAELDSDE